MSRQPGEWWAEGTMIFAMLPSSNHGGKRIATLVAMSFQDPTGFLAEDHPKNVLAREVAERNAATIADAMNAIRKSTVTGEQNAHAL